MTAYPPIAELYSFNTCAWTKRFPDRHFLPEEAQWSTMPWQPTHIETDIPQSTRFLFIEHPDWLPELYSIFTYESNHAIGIIEPDLRYLTTLFFVYDWRETILSPYVFWFVGDNWRDDLHGFIYRYGVFHYPPETIHLLTSTSLSLDNILHPAYVHAQQKFKRQWSQFIAKKVTNQPPRIWAYTEPSAAIYQGMTHAFLNAFQSQNDQTHISSLQTGWAQDKKLITDFVEFAPDVCFIINGPGQRTFDHLGFPQSMKKKIPSQTITWYVDHPRFLTASSTDFQPCSQDHIAVCDRSFIPWFQTYNPRSLFHLPHAATISREGRYQEYFDYSIVYVGGIVNPQRALESLSTPSRDMINLLTLSMRENQTPLIDPAAFPIEVSIRDEIIQCAVHFLHHHMKKTYSDPLQAFDYFLYIAATFKRRLSVIKKLLPLGLHIFGPNDWLPLIDQKYSDRVHGILDHQDLADCYASAKMQLNIHSLQCPTAINPRVYDVPYAGGLILTDWVEEMEHVGFHDGLHGIVIRDDEWQSKVEYYLSKADERESLRQTAQTWVMRNHTVKHRVQTIRNHLPFLEKPS